GRPRRHRPRHPSPAGGGALEIRDPQPPRRRNRRPRGVDVAAASPASRRQRGRGRIAGRKGRALSRGVHWLLFAAALWLAMVVAGIALRPLLPVDETRYPAVGGEMWPGGG